jgi:F-type H+-transporting ATPase subunit delta
MRVNRKAGRVARTLYRLCLVNGAVDGSRARRVSQRLASCGRRGSLPILVAFHRIVSLHHDRHLASVESAMPLDSPVRDHIRADVLRVYGPGVQTRFTENPGLIGGVRIRVGSDVYDGSLRSRLAALEARL